MNFIDNRSHKGDTLEKLQEGAIFYFPDEEEGGTVDLYMKINAPLNISNRGECMVVLLERGLSLNLDENIIVCEVEATLTFS
jgi:hypothetical protein